MAFRVAFQGVPGAYSEIALESFFSDEARALACDEFGDVFDAVAVGRARFGVLPIENSTTGSIHQNFDLLREHSLVITGEVKLRISHSLLGISSTRLSSIRHVYSHPQALWQCHRFLGRQKKIEIHPYFDTAGSARYIAELSRPDTAAIASERAARQYGLKSLKKGIEDNKTNFTRFLVLAKKPIPGQKGDKKTSIAYRLKSVPGALVGSLGAFREIQLYKIESRPIAGRPWEYLFYLDFAGDAREPRVKAALRELTKTARDIKVLGSYLRSE